MFKYILVVCECLIGIFGLYCIITGDNKHEKLHGLFVLGLAVEGLCDFFLGFQHIVSEIMLGFVTVLAVSFMVMSLNDAIVKKRLKSKLNAEGLAEAVSLAKAVSEDKFDLFNLDEKEYLENAVAAAKNNANALENATLSEADTVSEVAATSAEIVKENEGHVNNQTEV